MTFDEAVELVARARDKRSKPIANNTRVEKRDDDTYAIRLHATDVVTLHRDGRVVLRTGGWYTVTTKERINSYTPESVEVFSERGEWFVSNRQPNDPRPEWSWRTVLKPFHALDPGPEPVKPAEGCIAGTVREEDYEREVLVSKHELEGGTWREEDIVRPYDGGTDYFVGYAIKRGKEFTHYGESAYERTNDLPTGSINDIVRYEQCPHCNLFERQRAAWSQAMNGVTYPRSKANRGYRQMTEALERYGTREAWAEAYKQDGREVREAHKRYREWTDRNRLTFVDGMTFGPVDGTLRVIGITRDGKLTPIRTDKLEKERKDRATLQRTIKAFVNLAGERLDEGMDVPGPGDCWFCSMRDVETGTPWGDTRPDDHEHLLSHMAEDYVVPSMLLNAVIEAGYRFPPIILGASENGEQMGGKVTTQLGEERSRAMTNSVKRALRKYLTKRLVTGVTPR